ncbi:hypothetical protein Ndes2526A_g01401 [Nannochloris sp. 'desiccata']
MFASDRDPANWAKGMTAAFEEGANTAEAVQIFLAATYSQGWRGGLSDRIDDANFVYQITYYGDLVQAMELAHMLDSMHIKTICEAYILDNVPLYRVVDPTKMLAPILSSAVHCDALHLQKSIITEILMDIIEIAREKPKRWRRKVSQKFEDLLSYDLNSEMKTRLNKVMIELVVSGAIGASRAGTVFPGLGRDQIVSIMSEVKL